MHEPYASVIIPTHDRAATLAIAVESVQAQSVRDIEIFIVGDGALPDVADAARQIAGADSRVRFLDFAKAPGTGGANRDRAIRDFATSERIFYTDDDDLWLRQHIATMGPHLDRCDIVDTLPVSASACGRLALAPVNSSSPFSRACLTNDTFKMTFDTHLAHRRSTYLALGGPWDGSGAADLVRRMLGAFARSPAIRWRTLPLATAVSLHAGARATFTQAERRDEIVRWSRLIETLDSTSLASDAHPAWHFFACLNHFKAERSETFDQYLHRLGLVAPRYNAPSAAADLLVLPINADASRDMAAAFALHRGAAGDDSQFESLARLLLDAVRSCLASWGYLRRILRRLPPEEARIRVRKIKADGERAAELLSILEPYVLFWAGRYDDARDIAERLLVEVRLVPHEVEVLLAEIELASGRVDAGLDYYRRAAVREVRPVIALRLMAALLDAGRVAEARTRYDLIAERMVGHPQVAKLQRRLAEMEGVPNS